ncbi:SNF2 family N-terminal domain-containing protein [Stachybotrys elegans]|uniref:SNF2 family N-terminal domain-containing protein n=1 Tax=Stachybotrys elegans TaxID=80388 RepID=A0A8K0SLC6_9HYPO|nr:SNF2 family N-terminal domain-containing protein [Stachybotrys elegans]
MPPMDPTMSLKRVLHPEPDEAHYQDRREQRQHEVQSMYQPSPMGSLAATQHFVYPIVPFPSYTAMGMTAVSETIPSTLGSFGPVSLPSLGADSAFVELDLPEYYDSSNESIEEWYNTLAENRMHQETDGTPPSTLGDAGQSLFVEQPDASVSENSSLICYGMLYQADLKLSGKPEDLEPKLSTGQVMQQLKVKDSNRTIELFWPDEQDNQTVNLGYLTSAYSELGNLLLNEGVFIESVIPTHEFYKLIKNKKFKDLKVDLHIYGPERTSNRVKKTLCEKKLWLQKPKHLRENVEYKNPQAIRFPEIVDFVPLADQQALTRATEPTRPEAEPLQPFVNNVYSSLSRANNLSGTSGHRNLRTPLLDHQSKALSFMLQRESGEIPEEFRLWKPKTENGEVKFQHEINKQISYHPVDESGGGILADEMGMGKSLSILALIIQTLEASREWEAQQRNSSQSPDSVANAVHGTLILVTSPLLINHWVQEIERHLGGQDVIKTIRYHGSKRKGLVKEIPGADIVITTYHTLAVESLPDGGPLHKFGWYRIVLDEAHTIRRTSTHFHRNCANFTAKSRWCLTGTPIQNSLEDIGALFSFINVKPFDDPGTFRRCITAPFNSGGKDQIERVKQRLVSLMNSLTLRRTRETLHLPGLNEDIRYITLSEPERDLYRYVHKAMTRKIEQSISNGQMSDFNTFHRNLQLRIICNHGTFQKPLAWKKLNARDRAEAFVSPLDPNSEVKCSTCNGVIPIGYKNASVFKCQHRICKRCLEYPSSTSHEVRHCPLCTKVEEEDGDENYFEATGYSEKIARLMDDLKHDLQTTKSIVFSCWTRTLNLITRSLDDRGVSYLRIDGTYSLDARQKVLDQFAKDSEKHILLMTTGTGAFGLNLTCANRVFLVEPQWNPSVERQAVARTTRIGQQQPVQVIRYLVKESVEMDLRDQQKRKNEMADLGASELEAPNDAEAIDI